MRVALFEPDIPQNAATIIRLGACLGVPVDLIEPCGFVLSERGFRRAGLDYVERATIVRHPSWPAFRSGVVPLMRLVVVTTKADVPYVRFAFANDDVLLFGRESGGVPDWVHETADARVRVPMRVGLRSLNVAVAAAMVIGEAMRQTDAWPREEGG
jgi:tRNA (cytidine/uridine-2'-O-)-methyltransferase